MRDHAVRQRIIAWLGQNDIVVDERDGLVSGNGSVVFRPALAREALAIAVMSRELVEAGLGWRYTPIRMAALISDPETVALVACEAARILGFAVMRFGDETAHLALLCVDPAARRRGLGRGLTKWLVESAQVAGMVSITLELRADNLGALAFYHGLHFVETQCVPGYYSGLIAARRMVLPLRSDGAAG